MTHTTEYIPLQLDDGSIVQIEAEIIGGEEDVSLGTFKFSDLQKHIGDIARAVTEPFRQTSATKATVEFGLSAGIESGALIACIAKGQTSANLKITLEWSYGE